MKEHLLSYSGAEGLHPARLGMLKFKGEVVFGNPKDACKGIGICHLIVGDNHSSMVACRKGKRAKCILSLRFPGTLLLAFDLSTLSPDVEDLYFSKQSFFNPRMFMIRQFPGLSERFLPLRIPAGFHAILRDEKTLYVYLRLM